MWNSDGPFGPISGNFRGHHSAFQERILDHLRGIRERILYHFAGSRSHKTEHLVRLVPHAAGSGRSG
jgi:hypothetical protein